MAFIGKSVGFGCTLGMAAVLAACSSSSTGSGTGTGGGTSTSTGAGAGGGAPDIKEAHSDKSYDQSPSVPASDYATLVAGTNDFAFDLYKKIGAGDGNFFYSPLSTAAALAMTYAGARGQTATQMGAVLHDTLGADKYATAWNRLAIDLASRNVPVHATEEGDKSVKLHLVNAAWAQQGYDFVPAYLDTLAVHYDAGVKLLDFATDPGGSRDVINAWVASETEDRIKDLLPPDAISPDTKLVLTNALYFYGSWATPFDKAQTHDAAFHAAGADVMVPTMNGTLYAPYAKGDGYQATELAYDDNKLAMTIVLPDDGKMAEIEKGLSDAWVAKLSKDMSGFSGEVELSLPKFKFTWGTKSVKEALQGLGMKDAFVSGAADFSGIEAKKQLFVSDVLHQAFVGVDESGTEAAAATAVVINDGGIPDPPQPMAVNRPFLFLVRDTASGAVLFVGKVTNPKS